MKLKSLVLLATLASLCRVAQADDIYQFSYTSNQTLPWGDPENFSWTTIAVPLLTQTTAFSPDGITSVTDDGCTISATIVNPASFEPSVFTNFEGTTTNNVPCGNPDWGFSQIFVGAFSGPGTWTMPVSGGSAVMTITEAQGGGGDPTPEAASFILMATALLALFFKRSWEKGLPDTRAQVDPHCCDKQGVGTGN